MTHAYLSDLKEDQLRVEVWEAKKRAWRTTSAAASTIFRVPGVAGPAGWRRWRGRRVSHSVSTSRIGINTRRSDPFRLCRIAIMSDTGGRRFHPASSTVVVF